MEIQVPPEPPRLAKPPLWRTIVGTAIDLLIAMWMYRQPYRFSIFMSGVITAIAAVQVMEYVITLRHVKRLQADVDKTYAGLAERFAMLPKLIERHGPEQALELMQMADHLVSEGDFPDVKAAVASIERHHDLEPTTYD